LPRNIGVLGILSSKNSVYPQMLKLDFTVTPQIITAAAGLVATSLSISLGTFVTPAITNSLVLFDEYCIVGAIFEIRIVNLSNPGGFIIVVIDEKLAAAPTFASVEDKPHLEVLNQANIDKKYVVKWKAADYLDLQWTPVAINATPAYLKLLSSVAGTGVSAASTYQVTVTGALAVCFRGFS
jgi:hypothetical protein